MKLFTKGSPAASSAALIVVALAMMAGAGRAETVGFDRDSLGKAPSGWACGSTDGGAPLWDVEADDSAPSKPNVLVQFGSGTSPWCVKQGTDLANGFVEVKFKPLGGHDDQAGGVVWRWKDGDNYYVARADALDNNVVLFYTQGGRLRIVKEVSVPVTVETWHSLRVEFKDTRIRVLFDGQTSIELDDRRITGSGAVGVWTKADSVTAFDDFSWGPPAP